MSAHLARLVDADLVAVSAQGRHRYYRLRVAEVRRDYGMVERDQAPPDSRQQHG